MKFSTTVSTVLAMVAFVTPQQTLGAEIFFGIDMCPDIICPQIPQSEAAQANFLSSLVNPEVESFEGFAAGRHAQLDVTSFTTAGDVTMTSSNLRIEEDDQGQRDFGWFPISGNHFLKINAGGDFKITLQNPIAAFGFFGADLGDVGATIVVKTKLAGANEKEHPIDLTGATNGDVLFWGIIDMDTFDEFEFVSMESRGRTDGFAFDDFTVASLEFVCVGRACGDPHFQAWNNMWYDFHGICDLVLLSAQNFADGLGLDIHIRTKPRYEYSYIEAAAIKIGDDVLEVGSWGQHWFNGVEDAELPLTMGGEYTVTKDIVNKRRSDFKIELSSNEFIRVHNHKDMVNVEVSVKDTVAGNSVGLMGSYPDGKLLARDGATVMDDYDLFGQEWQVKESEGNLFQSPSPYKHHCVKPNTIKQAGRRLGETISEEAAATVCAKYAQDPNKMDMCIFDVIAMGDLEVADNVHGAF